jgi:hypothetical protein
VSSFDAEVSAFPADKCQLLVLAKVFGLVGHVVEERLLPLSGY